MKNLIRFSFPGFVGKYFFRDIRLEKSELFVEAEIWNLN